MKTNHLACYASVAAALLLTACGGDVDGASPEVGSCQEALGRLGGVTPESIAQPLVDRTGYATDYGRLIDFTNGEAPGSPRFVSYGSCQLAGSTVLRITLRDGTVIEGP